MGRNLLAGVKELLEMRPEGGAFEQAENTEGLEQQPSAGRGVVAGGGWVPRWGPTTWGTWAFERAKPHSFSPFEATGELLGCFG